jgi:uncharacterized membrane-anchored protein
MIRDILSALYKRVVVAYKSTLLGLALVAATAVVETLQAESLPTWARAVVGVVSAILVLYKGKRQAPALLPVP